MSNRKVLTLIAGLLLAGFGMWLWLGQVDAKIISQDTIIRRVVIGNAKTENAYLSLAYTADSQKYLYVNVVIDLNQDGKFASYQRDGKTQKEWAIQNMDTKVFASEGGNYDFKLIDPDVDNRKNIATNIILTKGPLKNWQGEKIRGSGYQATKTPSIEIDDVSTRFTLNPEGKTSGGLTENLVTPALAQSEQLPNRPPQDGESDAAKTGEAQGQARPSQAKEKTIETLSKEFEVFNGDVPDITQGKDECAPTAIANSLLWLAQKNKFADKMPKTQGELINELKGDLKWELNKGVLDKDFIPGKEDFANRHKISIETHRVNVKDYDVNIVAKIAQELRKGQDVEIGIEYWKKQADSKWKVVGGHWLTAVGATGTKDSQTIFVHDPASPGPSLLDIYRVNGTRIIDYRYQGDAVAYIQYAVAESPVTPPPTVPPADASAPTNSNSNSTINTPGPTFTGKYETGTEGSYFYINLMVTPTDLAGKEFSGMEIDLGAQNPALPATNNCSVNVNLTGWGASDWRSSKDGLVHRWSGNTVMQKGQKSIMTLYFNNSFTPPASMIMRVLDKDGNPVDVSLTQE